MDGQFDLRYFRENTLKLSSFLETHENMAGSGYLQEIEDIRQLIRQASHKPNVWVCGCAGAGKSTFINSLLGRNLLPASSNGESRLKIILKHEKDRPEFMADDLLILKKGKETVTDIGKLSEEEYCRKMMLASGSPSLLEQYVNAGTLPDFSDEADFAVLYINAPVLRNINLIDTPGLGRNTDLDEQLLQGIKLYADAIVYLSSSVSFMSGEDILFLSDIMRNAQCFHDCSLLPALFDNLYVVASKAHLIASRPADVLLEKGAEKLLPCLSSRIRNSLCHSDTIAAIRAQIRSRFFSYAFGNPDLCAEFTTDLQDLMSQLARIANEKTVRLVRWRSTELEAQIDCETHRLTGILTRQEERKNKLKEFGKNEYQRRLNLTQLKEKTEDQLTKLQEKTISDFMLACATIINEKRILDLISKFNCKNNTADAQFLANYLNAAVEDVLEECMKQNIRPLVSILDDYSASFASDEPSMERIRGNLLAKRNAALKSPVADSPSGSPSSLPASPTMGALLWPGVAGASLQVSGALSSFSASPSVWKKKLAKRIVELYTSEKTMSSYSSVIDNCWSDIRRYAERYMEFLESEWDEYWFGLKTDLLRNDEKKITRELNDAKAARAFAEELQNLAEAQAAGLQSI